MTDFARIGFPRGVARHAPQPEVPEPLVPRVGFPRRLPATVAPDPGGRRVTPSERFRHVQGGPPPDDIPY